MIRVLNKSFQLIGFIENLESLIWIERYQEPGEFEIYSSFSTQLYNLLQPDYFLIHSEFQSIMIIESIKIDGTSDAGYKIVSKGRSIESMLDRRIILRQILIDSSLQAGIKSILNANVINSIYPARNFPNFTFVDSTDPLVTTPTLKAQYYSEGLLEVIVNLLKQSGLGFKIRFDDNYHMKFYLYSGVDRTYSQTTNNFVVFSPEFDNLKSSEFLHTTRYKKTYALVSGDPTGLTAPERVEVGGNYDPGDTGGFFLWEIFVDASDISRYLEGTTTLQNAATYTAQLTQRGNETLAVYRKITQFDGKVELTDSYKYGVDFFLGDIIQMVDYFGHYTDAQILEMTISDNLSGRTMYPTLKSSG